MTVSHKKQLVRLGAMSAMVLAGCAVEPAVLETRATTSAVTVHDTDLAPECGGILSYVNGATLAELDSYLPSDVAAAIVQRRAMGAFSDLEDLSSVSGVAQARLELIAARARALGFIDAACAGVYEELAVSADDRALILTYVNTASEAALWDVVRTEPNTVAPLLVASRPYSSLQQLANVSGVGPSTFRSLRDAAVVDPFDELIGRVHEADDDTTIKTAFNWYAVAGEQPGHQAGMECFGVPADLVNSYGGLLRANLATGSEVLAQVTGTISYANRYGGVGSTTAGLAHLSAQVAGQTFLGCYIDYHPNPWCGVNRAFFVNKDTGYRVLTETRWCE